MNIYVQSFYYQEILGILTLFPLLKAFLIAIPALNFKVSRTEAIKAPQVVSAAIHLILLMKFY